MDELRRTMKKLHKSKKKPSKLRAEFGFMQKKQVLYEPLPFKCVVCDDRFKLFRNLRRHMTKHVFHKIPAGPTVPTARAGYILPPHLLNFEDKHKDEATPVIGILTQKKRASKKKRAKVPKHK